MANFIVQYDDSINLKKIRDELYSINDKLDQIAILVDEIRRLRILAEGTQPTASTQPISQNTAEKTASETVVPTQTLNQEPPNCVVDNWVIEEAQFRKQVREKDDYVMIAMYVLVFILVAIFFVLIFISGWRH